MCVFFAYVCVNESEENGWEGYGFGDIGVCGVWSENKKRERERESGSDIGVLW